MREKTPNWRGYAGIPVFVLVLVLSSGGHLKAESPTFAIDNSYERKESFGSGGENVNEVYDQNYNVTWTGDISDRLGFDVNFELTMNDKINSQGVDTKDLTPKLDLALINPLWDLKLTGENAIKDSNELGVEKTDDISLTSELNLSVPGISVNYDVLSDELENLEDLRTEKLEITAEYIFWPKLDVDLAYKTEVVDDRLRDDSDKDSSQWDLNLTYGALLTSSLKLDLNSTWDKGIDETLNNAGLVISRGETETWETKFKITMDGYPSLNSDMEISSNQDLIGGAEETKVSLNTEAVQSLLSVGDLKEILEITLDDLNSPDPAQGSQTRTASLTLGLKGTPSKWVDYSMEEVLEISDSRFPDSSNNKDSKNSTFDLSLTLSPTEAWNIDGAFNWGIQWENGVRQGESKTYKIAMDLNGEVLNIPNLTIFPTFNHDVNKDLETGDRSVTDSLKFEFEYSPVLPEPFSFVIKPTYTLDKTEGGDSTEKLTLGYDAGWELDWYDWSFNLEISGDYEDTLSDTEAETTSNDIKFDATSTVFGNINLDLLYTYRIPDTADNQAALELALEWELLNMKFSLSASGERTFDADKTESRTYVAEFFMDF